MKKVNIDQSVFKSLERRQKDKANTVFLKYYSRLNKPKNPFDEVRSYSLPQTNIKSGGNPNDPI